MTARVALAVLGDPLSYTRSPDLHRAGLASLGLAGDSEALRTPREQLGQRLRELAARGVHGVNLTAPLKEEALRHLARVSAAAEQSRSVNTVGLSQDGWWGDTTDGPGFLDWLGTLGRDGTRERVVLLGAGGAARSLALALISTGARVTASCRHPEQAEDAWEGVSGTRLVGWRSEEEARSLQEATMVVNATPLASEPAPLSLLPVHSLVVDLAYGPVPTRWVLEARAQGREAWDGLGLLVFQARRSLALWFSRPVEVDPLARAVGWPR
jgi:shikimate dehydrogenase